MLRDAIIKQRFINVRFAITSAPIIISVIANQIFENGNFVLYFICIQISTLFILRADILKKYAWWSSLISIFISLMYFQYSDIVSAPIIWQVIIAASTLFVFIISSVRAERDYEMTRIDSELS
jgi:hypothetical protein